MGKLKRLTSAILCFILVAAFLFSVGCGRTPEPEDDAVYYTITFNYGYEMNAADDAEAVKVVTVKGGEVPVGIPEPIRAGFSFGGWHEGSADGALFDPTAKYNYKKNIALYATWLGRLNTIFFDYGDGAGTVETIQVRQGEQITGLPVPTMLPTGKIFTGWKTEEELKVAEGTTYSFLGNITLFANYETETYVISYNVNGGDPLSAGAITSYSISESAIELPVPTKTGFEFLGWQEDGEDPIFALPANTVGDKNLVALWEQNYFTVTFNNVSDAPFTVWGDGTTEIKILNKEKGKTVSVPEMLYDRMSQQEKDDHDFGFSGWFYKDKTGAEREFDPAVLLTKENFNLDAYEFTLYPKVEKRIFTVNIQNETRDKKTGRIISVTKWSDGSEGVKTLYVEAGEVINMPRIRFDDMSERARNDNTYWFDGWFYLDKNGNEVQFDPSVALKKARLNTESFTLNIYAKTHKQWAGPY